MIRWYILRGKDAPTARDIIYAPDKASAQAQAHQMGEGVGVISVIEYEEVQRELSELRVRQGRAVRHMEALQTLDNTINAEKNDRPDLFAAETRAQAIECAKLVGVLNGEFWQNAMVGLGERPRYPNASPEAA